MAAHLGLERLIAAERGDVAGEQSERISKPAFADLTDAELLQRVGARDHRAFEALYRRFFPRVSRFAQRMLWSREAIEEIVNDVMHVVWRKASKFDERGRVSTWVLGIAYRTCLKHLGDRAPGEHLALDDAEDLIPGVSDSGLDELEHDDWVESLFGQLPLQQRAVLELTYHQDLKYGEIAEILGCPENTVKTRMFHARRKMKALMPRCGEENPARREARTV
jgi:RNA polymerase sigma-70 factor (ECF subfamily)